MSGPVCLFEVSTRPSIVDSVFPGSQETDFRPALHGHLQVDSRGCDIGKITGMVQRKIGLGLDLELGQLLLIVTFHPSGGIDINRLELAFDTVFILQALGYDLELQYTDGAKDQIIVGQWFEQLGCTFLAELSQPFHQGFHLQGILQSRAAEQFRCEVGDTGESQILALGEGVTDANGTVIVDADNIPGPGLVHMTAIIGHEGERIRYLDITPKTHMPDLHALLVLARADTYKSDAIPVLLVHIGLDLEHKTGEVRFIGLDKPG